MEKENKKNLAILFASFRPKQYPNHVCDGREQEYSFCINHFLNIIPLDLYDIVVADNTVKDLDSIKFDFLRNLLYSDNRIKDVYFFENNLGEDGNKGLGELQMLAGVLENIPVNTYKNVSYITARRIVANPYIFEKTDLMQKEALVSNPDFLYLTGKIVESEKKGMYNDMFFSMNESVIRSYSKYSLLNLEKNKIHNIGSEQNLYNFITENQISFEYLKWLGLIRNDWMLDFNQMNPKNIHIC